MQLLRTLKHFWSHAFRKRGTKPVLVLHLEFNIYHLKSIRHSYYFGPYLFCLEYDSLLAEKHLL